MDGAPADESDRPANRSAGRADSAALPKTDGSLGVEDPSSAELADIVARNGVSPGPTAVNASSPAAVPSNALSPPLEPAQPPASRLIDEVDPLPAAWGRRPHMLRAFAHRNYRLFFAGQIVSLCGTFLSTVAVLWLVYHITHDPRWLGYVGFAGQLPLFLITPFAGVLVDRVNRRRLLVVTQALSMLQSVALGVLALAGVLTAPLIALLALAQGLINAFDMPARQAFLVEMVTDRRDLANAIALNSTMVHTARLAGPALAGMLIDLIGVGPCFLLDGFSYLAVIASLLAMRFAPRPYVLRKGSVIEELKEGLDYAWSHRPIRALLLLMALLSLAGMPIFATLVPIFAHAFGGADRDSRYLGFLMAASGCGALIGALQLAVRKSVAGLGRLIAVAAVTFGVALLAFSFVRSLSVALLIVPVAGWAMLSNFASANTLIQTLAEEKVRGRVMSLFTVAFIGMAPFGNLLAGRSAGWFGRSYGAGIAADLAGAAITLRIAGVVCIAGAAFFIWRLPRLREAARNAIAAQQGGAAAQKSHPAQSAGAAAGASTVG